MKIDGEKINDPRLVVIAGTKHVYQVGKRKFARIVVNKSSVFPYHSYPGTNRATRADIRSARDFPVIIAF